MNKEGTLAHPTVSTFSVTKGGRIAETYACFSQWNLSQTLDENLRQFREKNPILADTEAWLKEMRRILHVRFGDIERHHTLIYLAKGRLPQAVWTPILLWHLCLRELLLSDFLETWLYPRKREGLLRVRSEDVRDYIKGLEARELVDRQWTQNTIRRMASGIPTYSSNFGLLRGKAVKEIASYHLPDEALLYVLHWLAEQSASAERILSDVRWRRFLMSRQDVEQELLRLHQLRRLRFDVMGSVMALELPFRTVRNYVKHLVRDRVETETSGAA